MVHAILIMAKFVKLEYSKRELNKAGQELIDPSSTNAEKEAALVIINNWRTSHNFPLNTFQKRLRRQAQIVNPESLVAQRIKRLASIKHKLERFPSMKMAQIQDIGGCRAIMKDISEVDELVNTYLHESRGVKHKIDKVHDYILNPKESGYRGVHLIYKYQSDKTNLYEDMRIEIQIRTLIQHAWATAVETVGTFIQQSLKSSQGEENWLQFFKLMASAMATQEGKPGVANTPTHLHELRIKIKELSVELDVEGHLTAFRDSIEVLADRRLHNAHYYLLELDAAARKIRIKSYKHTQLATASSDYITLESRLDINKDAVLVSADSIEALKLAFPNYYLDTDVFLRQLKIITSAETGQFNLFD